MENKTTPKLCECGCGEPAPISPYSYAAKGYVKGEARRFVSGHNAAHRPFTPLSERYIVEDRGYSSPCWIWQMSRMGKGYGNIWDRDRYRLMPAHRYFYEHFVGPIPDGLQIDHLCRVRLCVNPDHLEPVTQEVNQRRGANAKLTDQDRVEIATLLAQGEKQKTIAVRFGVSPHPIHVIAKRMRQVKQV